MLGVMAVCELDWVEALRPNSTVRVINFFNSNNSYYIINRTQSNHETFGLDEFKLLMSLLKFLF